MRCATFSLTGQDGGFFPADTVLAAAEGVHRDSILEITLLTDGTCVILYELHGNIHRASDVLEAEATVVEHELTDDNPAAAYIHFHPNDTVVTLLTIQREYPLILKPPVACLSDGVQANIIGADDTLQQAVEEIPADLSLTLESISDYTHTSTDPFNTLTTRQREILTTAAKHGYYAVPRQTSHKGIADELGLSESTVSEHLQKAEAKLLGTLLTQ